MSTKLLLIVGLLLSGVMAADKCGDAKGPSCGSWFSTFTCESGGSCCHDAFNTWCCPPKFKCQGAFKDPGGNRHCMTPTKHSHSCVCEDLAFYVTKVEPVGERETVGYSITNFTTTCATGAEGCGISSSNTWTQQQSMTWDNSVTTTIELSAQFNVEFGKVGLSTTLSGTFRHSETKSITETIQTTIPCKGPSGGFPRPTRVILSSSVGKYAQNVQMTYDQCGVEARTDAKVTATIIQGDWECMFVPPLDPCEATAGYQYEGLAGADTVETYENMQSWEACSTKCRSEALCEFWTWDALTNQCTSKKNFKTSRQNPTVVSGLKCTLSGATRGAGQAPPSDGGVSLELQAPRSVTHDVFAESSEEDPDVEATLARLQSLVEEQAEELEEMEEGVKDLANDIEDLEDDVEDLEDDVEDLEADNTRRRWPTSRPTSASKKSRSSSDSFDDSQSDEDDWEPNDDYSEEDLETHLENQLERGDMDCDELKDRAEKVFEVVADQRIKDFVSKKSEVDTPQERYVLGMNLIADCLDEMPHDILLGLVESATSKRIDRRLVLDTFKPLRRHLATMPPEPRRRKAWWEYLIEGIATAAEIALEIFSDDSSSSSD